MKGIVLAGGLGTRLYPITREVNKHLLPLYDRPMFYWPLLFLVESGISEIAVVSGPPRGYQIKNSLKYFSKNKNLKLTFINQKSPKGMPDAIAKCSKFIGKDNFIVSVGDNIYGKTFKKEVDGFKNGAIAFARKVKDPERFGVVKFDKNKKIEKIVEKPKEYISNLAVCSPYMFDNTALAKIKKLKPSKRGELEIVDLLTCYIHEGNLKLSKRNDLWADTGTPDSLLKAQNIAKKLSLKHPYIFEK
jgi:glucose-1-phosphate thymidylyltransferase